MKLLFFVDIPQIIQSLFGVQTARNIQKPKDNENDTMDISADDKKNRVFYIIYKEIHSNEKKIDIHSDR